ncbi:DNA topoisomerase (ATP-hydrolyzing) subunit B [Spiroplasma citri]|uniref:DNA topoisomerase (ATP-hydrolyzing) subunit B n=1 Tax=Spiroplasma citri TaxID=2133 RepID=UPI000901C4E0|nr:DNA topoisomerase (ATP-hydrolyzing) subunit B [Spiroplasma citri]APE73924.1 DNA gyrase subunit B [Spiroplasma citri]QIA74266.1 DNA topoisomerase (ATP-hydrolyzing) subunit B [Spiroplasma citri]
MGDNYNSESIQILEGLEAIRKRPGMYIGATNARGLHHLVWEIVDNSIDEVLANFANKIKIILNKDESITVIDNGRGIPIEIHPKTKVSTLETVFTILHAGGKFDSNTYKISGGLHGVGASVVNALSKYLKVEVRKNNKKYVMEFHNGGQILTPIKEVGSTSETGTTVTFLPDEKIFKETTIFSFSTIQNRIKQLVFLNKGLEISLVDLREEDEEKTVLYQFNNGIKDYVLELNKTIGTPLNDVFYVEGIEDNIVVEFGLQYNDNYSENIFSFCNNINTHEGGTHEEGARLAIVREINNYFKNINKNNKGNEDKFTWDDIKEGMTIIISIRHPEPQYEGQTKTKLGNSEVKKIVSNIVGKGLSSYLLENPEDAKKIIEKISLSLKARIVAQRAKEITRRKIVMDSFSLPGKLSDCETKDAKIAELYIVEGDSAGGSAKSGRNRKFQAILPLRGKILNVEKAKQIKIFENNEINSIITALGAGIKDNFNDKKLRYQKVIIMTDADVDGAHIRILLLTFFYRYMKDLIENGNIYIAQPPLYKVENSNQIRYVYSDNELELYKEELLKQNKNYTIQRYKGLGEMNPEQLWETTMDPERRLLLKVSVNNAFEANLICNELMGENVEPRKKFIRENAKYVKNLDV